MAARQNGQLVACRREQVWQKVWPQGAKANITVSFRQIPHVGCDSKWLSVRVIVTTSRITAKRL